MSKFEYTVEDFVLDCEFQKWILSPDEITNLSWEDFLKKYPSKYQDIVMARTILLNMSREFHPVSGKMIESTWENIERVIEKMDGDTFVRRVVPLHSLGSIKKKEPAYRLFSKLNQFYKLVGILVVAFALAIVANISELQDQQQTVEAPIIYEEHYAPPGVKSNLTLQDGSKVILNSGSSFRYLKNFETDQRELELNGEAFFEVVTDSMRPFRVKTGSVTTTALGTSFNIKAYENEQLDISLLTGLVEIDVKMDQPEKVYLVPGEALSINIEKQKLQKGGFDEEKLMAWTKKMIIFNHTPITEIKRVLENWYGVQNKFTNRPRKDLLVSGLFRDQTLVNVLQGLGYSARFEFDVDRDQVTITFK